MKAKFIYEMSSLNTDKFRQIKSWLNEMNIKGYVINDDLTIDVKDDVDLAHINLNNFPNFIKFNKVKGNFICFDNNLTSLKGCPNYVGADFSCYKNNLTSLEGCPTYVGYNFFCHYNNLTSLEGCPEIVYGNFYCYNNKKEFTEDDVIQFCDVKGNIHI